MTIPSPSRLAKWIEPFAGARGVPIRVWAAEADPYGGAALAMEREIFGGPPRLVCLGGGEDGLVVVRQTRDGSFEDMDGLLLPWEHVVRIERDPHLVRDLVTVEVRRRPPLQVAVSNHVLIPGNRSAAKALCDLARNSPHAEEGRSLLDTRGAPPPPSCNLPPRAAPGLA